MQGRVAADALEAPVLEHAQHLGLQADRHLADLVEKQRAAVRDLELPGLAGVGAGERPLLVAEQLGLEQRLGNRRTVDRDKRSVGPIAVRMKRTREQFLARPALTSKQHGGVGRGNAPQVAQHLEQRRVLADDRWRAVTGAERLLQQEVLGDDASLLDGAADRQDEVFMVDGLGQVVECALTHRRHGFLDRAVTGHQQDRQGRIEFLDGPQDAQAIALRQAQVGQDQRRPMETEGLDRRRLVGRLDDTVAVP